MSRVDCSPNNYYDKVKVEGGLSIKKA
jgi:hypothetical protein